MCDFAGLFALKRSSSNISGVRVYWIFVRIVKWRDRVSKSVLCTRAQIE